MTRQQIANTPSQRRTLNLGPLQDNMGYLSRALRNVVQQSSGEFVGELDLAAGQLTLVGLIAANEGVTQNELARVMLMRKSQVTMLIQDLVVRGHVARQEHEADRRYLTLTLTASGQALWETSRKRIEAHNEMLLKALDPTERADLIRLLQKMVASHASEAVAAGD